MHDQPTQRVTMTTTYDDIPWRSFQELKEWNGEADAALRSSIAELLRVQTERRHEKLMRQRDEALYAVVHACLLGDVASMDRELERACILEQTIAFNLGLA